MTWQRARTIATAALTASLSRDFRTSCGRVADRAGLESPQPRNAFRVPLLPIRSGFLKHPMGSGILKEFRSGGRFSPVQTFPLEVVSQSPEPGPPSALSPARIGLGVLLLLPILVVGCSHYRLGTASELKFKTLSIEPIENSTALPQAIALVSTYLRETFLRDGRVTLVDRAADADATLVINLAKYGRDVATVLPNDTGLARKFDLSLNGTATLRDNRTGTKLFTDRPLAVRRQIFTDNPRAAGEFGNQLQAEYQALPLLAEALASAAAHAVLDVW